MKEFTDLPYYSERYAKAVGDGMPKERRWPVKHEVVVALILGHEEVLRRCLDCFGMSRYSKMGRSLSAKLDKQSSGRDIDADHNYSMDADHFSICKPFNSISDDRFLKLKDFISDILPTEKPAQIEKPAEQLIHGTRDSVILTEEAS
ncbi:hypothetical protein AXG93_1478s1100 [Marchantia polymorpha subsp. ruderalis]|uniref:Uncharacterized protein n=1 Tax=Marchantia polymorpha subsp. ruderalis TaxID=1480154 RepID=A0A176VLW0_MARPO|nr:hypothetical protein AXG93_1478s1100 [Marchantia polymorpha subsp. ruderalis]